MVSDEHIVRCTIEERVLTTWSSPKGLMTITVGDSHVAMMASQDDETESTFFCAILCFHGYVFSVNFIIVYDTMMKIKHSWHCRECSDICTWSIYERTANVLERWMAIPWNRYP